MLNMRAAAQICEGVVGVERYFRGFIDRLAVFIHAALLQSLDQIDLKGLVFEDLPGFFGRDDFFLELVFSGNDLAHAFFNRFEIFRGKLAGEFKVVIEAIHDWWADGDLGFAWFEKLHNGLGHDMGGGMSNFI